jgi:hypothetical protein
MRIFACTRHSVPAALLIVCACSDDVGTFSPPPTYSEIFAPGDAERECAILAGEFCAMWSECGYITESVRECTAEVVDALTCDVARTTLYYDLCLAELQTECHDPGRGVPTLCEGVLVY